MIGMKIKLLKNEVIAKNKMNLELIELLYHQNYITHGVS